MVRSRVAGLGLIVLVGVAGCTVEGDDGDTNPFGTTAATATVASEGAAPTGDPTTAGEGSATGTSTTSTTSPTTTPGDTSSTGSSPETSGGPSGDSSGDPGDGQLGGCIGTGAWASCAMYCEANLDACVEGGCDGSTVAYYKDATDCDASQPDGTEATPCDAPLVMDGGISFARCCCG
jgi:hypothetical protein